MYKTYHATEISTLNTARESVCPVCGVVEGTEPLPISEDEKKRLIAEIDQAEIKRGRVKPLNAVE